MTDKPHPSAAHRGFAAMTPEQRRAVASAGGRAAHAAGTAHEWTREDAKRVGRIGGLASAADRERMREIGRKGGLRRQQLARDAKAGER